MELDADNCYRALLARDSRFDGVFFIAVKSTRVYCRPICPARTPRRENCEFHTSAVAAEQAGFRPCLRCRPELAPGSSSIDSLSQLARRAVRFLETESVEGAAARLGVTSRHLRRAMKAEMGITPVELQQSQRVALAKRLLHDTSLPITQVAFASGFSSVRRFNTVFRARAGMAPSAIRRTGRPSTDTIRLRLDYRPPFDFSAMLEFLAVRAMPGVERVSAGEYARTLRLGNAEGIVRVTHSESRAALWAEVSSSLAGVLPVLVPRLRRMFDLDARPGVIETGLAGNAALACLVRARPGLRIPGALDAFDVAVRAVLGQQISVAGATTLAGRFARKFGEPASTGIAGLDRFSPTVSSLAAADPVDLAELGIMPARAQTMIGMAKAIERGDVALDDSARPEDTVAGLVALRGIGDWTAQYIAMRALNWPDAFPAGDLVLRKYFNCTEGALRSLSDKWKPWRAYAAMHIWRAAAGDGNEKQRLRA